MEIPALNYQSEHYPPSWKGKVPKRIKMAITVHADFPFKEIPPAIKDRIYEAWVNSHGAVAAIMTNGTKLGIKPYEFEIIEWHEPDNKALNLNADKAPSSS